MDVDVDTCSFTATKTGHLLICMDLHANEKIKEDYKMIFQGLTDFYFEFFQTKNFNPLEIGCQISSQIAESLISCEILQP